MSVQTVTSSDQIDLILPHLQQLRAHISYFVYSNFILLYHVQFQPQGPPLRGPQPRQHAYLLDAASD